MGKTGRMVTFLKFLSSSTSRLVSSWVFSLANLIERSLRRASAPWCSSLLAFLLPDLFRAGIIRLLSLSPAVPPYRPNLAVARILDDLLPVFYDRPRSWTSCLSASAASALANSVSLKSSSSTARINSLLISWPSIEMPGPPR